MKSYQWKTDTTIISGGYTGEDTGIISGTTDWHTTDTATGSTSEQYYYRDSSTSQNSNSSRVVVGITESWTASVNSRNYLTITLTTTIDSITRDDIQGSPWISPNARYRNIYLRRESGGAVLWSTTNDAIDSAHTILSSPIVLDTYTFTLAPGQDLSRGSIYYVNVVPGHESDVLPNIYTDVMWVGTSFKNPLPEEAIPHAVLGADGKWYSHNRDGGDLRLWDGAKWSDNLPNTDWGVGYGDPPSVMKDSKWLNARVFGIE